jgi:tRNA(Arg) A34 adenosine deaminase TadA
VIRDRSTELISVGRNAILSSRDPLGHAEINAVRGIQSLFASLRTGEPQRARPWTGELPSGPAAASTVFFRRSPTELPPGGVQSLLYTSLEPCPMCTVALISSRIARVVVAAPDERGGALAPDRFARLPRAWSALASRQGLTVDFAAGDGAVPADLIASLSHAFLDTKDARDAAVSEGVLLHADIASAIARVIP